MAGRTVTMTPDEAREFCQDLASMAFRAEEALYRLFRESSQLDLTLGSHGHSIHMALFSAHSLLGTAHLALSRARGDELMPRDHTAEMGRPW